MPTPGRTRLCSRVHAAGAQFRGLGRVAVAREVALQAAALVLGAATPGAGAAGSGLLALMGLVAALLVVRLCRPALALVVAAALLPVLAPGLWLAAAAAALSVGRRQGDTRRLAMVVFGAGATAVAVAVLAAGIVQLASVSAVAVLALVVVAAPALCGALLGRRRRPAQLLAERNAYLERARELTIEQARWQERERITSEMHDLLGHHLSLVCLHAGALQVSTRAHAPQLSDQARLLRTTAASALDELRLILAATPPPADGHEQVLHTRQDLLALVEHWRAAGMEISVTWHGRDLDQGHLAREVERAVREALTNAHKHAPGAATSITVTTSDQRATITVRTAATTAAARAGTKLGLLALAERARLLGGHATYGPTEDGGFELVVDVPTSPPSNHRARALDNTSASAPSWPKHSAPVSAHEVLTWPRLALALGLVGVLPLAVLLASALGQAP